MNDVVLTHKKAWFTDSQLPRLRLPLGRHGRLPEPSKVVTLPLSGDGRHSVPRSPTASPRRPTTRPVQATPTGSESTVAGGHSLYLAQSPFTTPPPATTDYWITRIDKPRHCRAVFTCAD